MTKTEMCRKVTDLGKYGRRTLVYSLTADTADEKTGREEYGVAVTVYESGEETAVRRVSVVRDEAEWLLDLLATNFVTPVALADVVDDWLAR